MGSCLGRLPGQQAVRVQSLTEPLFFSIVVVCLFCLLFLSLDMFSFYSTAGPLFKLQKRFCDKRC